MYRLLWEGGLILAFLALVPRVALANNDLIPLATPGPRSGVSSLVAYSGRVWFVNSVKFVDYNSADLYSYDPVSGALSAVTGERLATTHNAGAPGRRGKGNDVAEMSIVFVASSRRGSCS